jgi:hypothetical protein
VVVALGIGSLVVPCDAASYRVTIDTRPLAAQPAVLAPFSLEFQLIDGGGTTSNTVAVRSIDLGAGGGPIGVPALTGGASGDLTTGVQLTDAAFLNELIQPFTPSAVDPLTFVVDLSESSEPVTPDAFSIAILDSSGQGLPTTYFDVLLQADIRTTPTLLSYGGDPAVPPPGCPTCAPVPLAKPQIGPVTVNCDLQDVTSEVEVVADTARPAGRKGLYVQHVRITNRSGRRIRRRILLALDGLSNGVRAVRADGLTTCPPPADSPFFEIENHGLRPAQTERLTLTFDDPHSLPITYAARVLAGPGR